MLYCPSSLVKASFFDFSKTYNPQTCSPHVAQMLQDLGNMRQNFYGMFEHISARGDHEVVENVDFMTQIGYLDKVPDLLEYSVSGANFPLLMQWESGAYPGQAHSIPDDNEAAATTELVMSRMLSVTGTLASSRGHIAQFRLAVSQRNTFQAKEVMKPILERMMFSSVRLYKMNYCANLIYPGLHQRAGPLECRKEYALMLYLLCELNMASLMIEKTFFDLMTDTSAKMVCNNALLAIGKVQRVRNGFQNFACSQTQEVLGYCMAAEFYFESTMLFAILELNNMMNEGIIDKTKDVETLYVENMVLSNYLLDMKEKWEGVLAGLGNDPCAFVSRENIVHTLSHYNSEKTDYMRKCIGVYEATKDGISSTKFKHYNIETIKATLVAGDDNVNTFIKNKTGIVDM